MMFGRPANTIVFDDDDDEEEEDGHQTIQKKSQPNINAEDDHSDDEVTGFSSMVKHVPQLHRVEAKIDKKLEKLVNLPFLNRLSNAASVEELKQTLQDEEEEDDDDEEEEDDDSEEEEDRLNLTSNQTKANKPIKHQKVDGFVAHQLEYKESLLAKKMKLYEKQLQHRSRQIEQFQKIQKQAEEQIKKLQKVIEDQREEFEKAEEQWEEEKVNILRFRGANNAGSTVMVHTGALGALGALGTLGARNRNRNNNHNDTEMHKQRMQMLNNAAEAQEQIDGDAVIGSGSGSNVTWMKIKRFFIQLSPFSSDLRQIESRFGNSVASYFKFFRWIILCFIAVVIPCTYLLSMHILIRIDEPSFDWGAFSGIAPKFILFPDYLEQEALLYTGVLVCVQVFLLFLTVRKWVAEDKFSKTIEAVEGGKQPKYCKALLNSWDFDMTLKEQVSDLKKSIAEQIKITIEEEKIQETLRKRTKKEKYILYGRRLIAFVLYCILQASSWYVILLLTTQSSNMQLQLAIKIPFLANYVASIVPAVVTVINSALPTIISFLTKMEKWDDVGFSIKAMVTRLFLAKILNILIQLFSFALLLDPFLLTSKLNVFGLELQVASIRKNVMLEFKKKDFTCRAEQVASGLLTLVVTDFSVSKIMAIVPPLLQWTTKAVQILIIQPWKEKKKKSSQKVAPISQSITSSSITSSSSIASVPENNNTSRVLSTSTEVEVPEVQSVTQSISQEKESPALAPPALPASVVLVVASSPREKEDGVAITVKQSFRQIFEPFDQKNRSEFLVPQKMVALFYSITITLIAIPLAPGTALVSLLLLVSNFKFDKVVLMHFQKKPINPWSAKDAGNFFIKFYFCTILIFAVCTHLFLLDPNLPKACHLQDLLLPSDQQLCQGTYDPKTLTCHVNPDQFSHGLFLVSSGKATECTSEQYPKCICSIACGPFMTFRSGYSPLIEYIQQIQVVSTLYSILSASVVMIWVLFFALLLALFFLRNSLKVYMFVTAERDHEMSITLATFRKKIKQLENRLKLTKLSTATAGGGEE